LVKPLWCPISQSLQCTKFPIHDAPQHTNSPLCSDFPASIIMVRCAAGKTSTHAVLGSGYPPRADQAHHHTRVTIAQEGSE
jgi:hypothetical protein